MKVRPYEYTVGQDQDSLLVIHRNDNHSPGPVIRELVPSSHQRSELSNTIFSGWDQRIGEGIPIPDSLGEEATFINICIGNGSLKCHRGQVDTFILDFEKAFDTPPHELLKSKLFSYGIGGKTLKWIDSFLCFRQQRVVVNGVKSDWAPVLSGVPQGTVLGPLLFSLYINDISSDIESEIRLFADDCVCYREIKDEKDTMKLQRDIDRLGSWARKWGMRFQPVKCNMMQLTRKRIKKKHMSIHHTVRTVRVRSGCSYGP